MFLYLSNPQLWQKSISKYNEQIMDLSNNTALDLPRNGSDISEGATVQQFFDDADAASVNGIM